MKYILIFNCLAILTFSACKKEDITPTNLPYVNLKYPAVGQISKYQYYESQAAFDFCSLEYMGDTVVLEIVAEAPEGFLLQRYFTKNSLSRTDPDGIYSPISADTFFTTLQIKTDTAFLQHDPAVYIDDIFLFDQIPLTAPTKKLAEVLPCTSATFSDPDLTVGKMAYLAIDNLSIKDKIYPQASSLGIFAFSFGPIQTKEINLNSYHQVIRSVAVAGQLVFGFELITE